MKIRWKDQFKEDIERIQERLKKPDPFKKAFCQAIRMLEAGKDLTEQFNAHRLVSEGEGWFCCFVFEEIIMIYKIQGQYVKLSRLGTPKELEKERS